MLLAVLQSYSILVLTLIQFHILPQIWGVSVFKNRIIYPKQRWLFTLRLIITITHIFPRFQKERQQWVFIWAIHPFFISTWALPLIFPIPLFLIFPITFPKLQFVQRSLDLSPRCPFSEVFQYAVKHFEKLFVLSLTWISQRCSLRNLGLESCFASITQLDLNWHMHWFQAHFWSWPLNPLLFFPFQNKVWNNFISVNHCSIMCPASLHVYPSNLSLSWKHHWFCIVAGSLAKMSWPERSLQEDTQSPCVLSASALHWFWPGSQGANPWPIPSRVVLGLENDPWFLARQNHTVFLHQATCSAWLPNIASSSHPPTHPLTLYLFKPPVNKQGEKKNISEAAAKKQSDSGQEVCRAQEGLWLGPHRRMRTASPPLISSRQSYHASPTHQPSCSPPGSEAQNGLKLKRELFIYPAARCF